MFDCNRLENVVSGQALVLNSFASSALSAIVGPEKVPWATLDMARRLTHEVPDQADAVFPRREGDTVWSLSVIT